MWNKIDTKGINQLLRLQSHCNMLYLALENQNRTNPTWLLKNFIRCAMRTVKENQHLHKWTWNLAERNLKNKVHMCCHMSKNYLNHSASHISKLAQVPHCNILHNVLSFCKQKLPLQESWTNRIKNHGGARLLWFHYCSPGTTFSRGTFKSIFSYELRGPVSELLSETEYTKIKHVLKISCGTPSNPRPYFSHFTWVYS